jgi:hypothetical protein
MIRLPTLPAPYRNITVTPSVVLEVTPGVDVTQVALLEEHLDLGEVFFFFFFFFFFVPFSPDRRP